MGYFKLLMTGVVVILLTVMLVGCGKPSPESTITPALEESTPVPQLPPMIQSNEDGSFFLEINSPEQSEVIVDTDSIVVAGNTTVDAAVSVGASFVDVGIDGSFETTVHLEDGVNIIEVVASTATGEQFEQIIAVIYIE